MSHCMRDKKLRVKHTVSYKAEPLVCFGNLPGFDAELTPAQIRALAAAMLTAADDCEQLADHTRWYGPVRREYDLVDRSEALFISWAEKTWRRARDGEQLQRQSSPPPADC